MRKRRENLDALGAQPAEILRTALGQALKVPALGSAGGLVLGMMASRVLAHIVFQASPRDPLCIGRLVLAVSSRGLPATWFLAPRRGATIVHPGTGCVV